MQPAPPAVLAPVASLLASLPVDESTAARLVARVQQRSGLTEQDIRRIMAAQAARARRLEVADDVILNDATTTPDQLRARALTLHDRWLALATTTGR